MSKLFRSTTIQYTVYGALFGFCFPLMATPMDAWLTHGELTSGAMLAVQQANPLLWIINTAPVFLGIFAGIAGARQERVEDLAARQEQTIHEQTKDLRQALADAEKANEARTAFLANISEGISTPVQAVVTKLDRLTTDPRVADSMGKAQADLLSEAQSQSHELFVSLTNLIDYTKLEAGTIQLQPKPVAPRDIANEAIGVISATADAVQIRFDETDIAANKLVEIDAIRVRQILINLLNLSLRYTKRGEICITVESASESTAQASHRHLFPDLDQQLKFVIDDTGVGLPTDRLERLFRPIDHLDQTTHRYGETGLGLAVSKALCEMMGGRLEGEYKGKRMGNRYSFTVNAKAVEPNIDEHEMLEQSTVE